MSQTIKSVRCDADVLSVGDKVLIHRNVEMQYDFISRIVPQLPSKNENDAALRGPSYSANGRTTYYIGCGVVTRVCKNDTCWVRLETSGE